MVNTTQGIGSDLLARLNDGAVICAEGYLFELERRGYVQAGPFVPIVVLDHPEAVRQLHLDFARAGSDVMEAFTYYGHREKLRVIGMEEMLEPLNRQALQIAREVAEATGTMLCGDICNTNVYEAANPETHKTVRAMFEEQVGWAAEYDVDYMVAETFSFVDEALIAIDVARGAGKPVVAMLALHNDGLTLEGHTPADACRMMEDAGADVVGLNCARGPDTMLPAIAEIREAVSCHVAALPVPYRTTEAQPTFQTLRDPGCSCLPDEMPFPTALDPFTCNRYELGVFAEQAFAMGVHYLGVCCGAGPHHIRAVAEALGRQPAASDYSPDMSRHAFFGSNEAIPESYRAHAKRL